MIQSQIVETGYPTVAYNTLSSVTTHNECSATNGNKFVLVVAKAKMATSDLGGFKTWLQANNLNLKYQLKTPTTEPDTGSSVDLVTGNTVVCIKDVTGTPTSLSSFVIEPAPTLSEFTRATTNNDGLSGAVLTPLKGEEKWLSSQQGWSSLPKFNGSQDGLIPKDSKTDGKNFLSNDGTWKSPLPSVYKGATALANGVEGLVPSALIADRDKAFFGDGTWRNVVSWNGDNYFGGVNTFRILGIESNINKQFTLTGVTGTPFDPTMVDDTNSQFIINNTTVGTKSTTSFSDTGNSANGVSSEFAWYTNSATKTTDVPTLAMKLDSNDCLSIGDQTKLPSKTNMSLVCEKGIKTNGELTCGDITVVNSTNASRYSTLSANNLTTNRLLTLPDKNGTIALMSDINSSEVIHIKIARNDINYTISSTAWTAVTLPTQTFRYGVDATKIPDNSGVIVTKAGVYDIRAQITANKVGYLAMGITVNDNLIATTASRTDTTLTNVMASDNLATTFLCNQNDVIKIVAMGTTNLSLGNTNGGSWLDVRMIHV